MRGSEFCIPAGNKATISITPNWYDRRALDTRSNYALYNSLLHLANLCSTSPKVRDSLACDGGLEQIVRILKQGKLCRMSDHFQMPKWQQALLCAVNIGVRGSEAVRIRLVEAEIVSIIVTILSNAIEHIIATHTPRQRHIALSSDRKKQKRAVRSSSFAHSQPSSNSQDNLSRRPYPAGLQNPNIQSAPTSSEHQNFRSPLAATELDSMFQAQGTSILTLEEDHPAQPQSSDPELTQALSDRLLVEYGGSVEESHEPVDHNLVMTSDSDDHLLLARVARTIHDTSLTSEPTSMPPEVDNLQQSHVRHDRQTTSNAANYQTAALPRWLYELDHSCASEPGMPTTWDQDVTLCLRLLAYLSKYPHLRSSFSESHDVPSLKQNLKQYELHHSRQTHGETLTQMSEDISDALQIPFNVFQLVEKFTTQIHGQESTYWAGVIMRNSCRRHEPAGVRQCAYLECGKWETQNRQFAKCRRCRRTKYCSKACQSKAWTGHRYWCSSMNVPGDTFE